MLLISKYIVLQNALKFKLLLASGGVFRYKAKKKYVMLLGVSKNREDESILFINITHKYAR
jgi:hypothetical protein